MQILQRYAHILQFKVILSLFHLLLASLFTGQEAAEARQLSAKPRIVSLAPSLTEMVFAIGAGGQLVGRTTACDFPAAAARVAVVGAFGRPSLELLASIHPDLVIDTDLADEEMGKKIAALGIQRVTLPCKSPDDIPLVLRKIGKLSGHQREADSLALVITNGLATFRNQAQRQQRKKTLYLEIWNDPFWTGGKGSYTSALTAYAGGRNIGDVVRKEYFEISQEWVISQNPDVIACMYMARNSSAFREVISRPGWSSITAVKNRQVYDRFDNNLFLRPGPRVLDGITLLHKVMYPEENHSQNRR